MPENVAVGLLPPDHLESLVSRYRYAVARQFARGSVVDAACGWGYGTAMLAASPKVDSAQGLDRDERAIWHAQKVYTADKISFGVSDLDGDFGRGLADTLVSLETLEHLKSPAAFTDKLNRSQISRAIVSIPIIPTVAKNPFHLHDLTRDDLFSWFKDWECVHEEIQRNTYLIAAFTR